HETAGAGVWDQSPSAIGHHGRIAGSLVDSLENEYRTNGGRTGLDAYFRGGAGFVGFPQLTNFKKTRTRTRTRTKTKIATCVGSAPKPTSLFRSKAPLFRERICRGIVGRPGRRGRRFDFRRS